MQRATPVLKGMDSYTIRMLESLNFLQVLTLLLVALLFGKDTILPWIGEKIFGIKRRDDTPASQRDRLETKMDELQLHYNHETTDLLREIRDNTQNSYLKLQEFEKYGIPCRDKR